MEIRELWQQIEQSLGHRIDALNNRLGENSEHVGNRLDKAEESIVALAKTLTDYIAKVHENIGKIDSQQRTLLPINIVLIVAILGAGGLATWSNSGLSATLSKVEERNAATANQVERLTKSTSEVSAQVGKLFSAAKTSSEGMDAAIAQIKNLNDGLNAITEAQAKRDSEFKAHEEKLSKLAAEINGKVTKSIELGDERTKTAIDAAQQAVGDQISQVSRERIREQTVGFQIEAKDIVQREDALLTFKIKVSTIGLSATMVPRYARVDRLTIEPGEPAKARILSMQDKLDLAGFEGQVDQSGGQSLLTLRISFAAASHRVEFEKALELDSDKIKGRAVVRNVVER